MAKRSNVATVRIGDKKYEIESDTLVNIKLKNGGSFESVRITGLSRMGDCIRGVSTDSGIIEVPLASIEIIVDSVKGDFPGVTVSKRTF